MEIPATSSAGPNSSEAKPKSLVGSISSTLQGVSMLPLGMAYLGAQLMMFENFGSPFTGATSALKGTGFDSLPLTAAAIAGASVALVAVANLNGQDMKNAGAAIKGFGQSILGMAANLGERLGLTKEGEQPIVKATEPAVENRSYWGSTAVISLKAMLASPAIVSAAGTPFLLINSAAHLVSGHGLPGALLATGAAAAIAAVTWPLLGKLEKLDNALQPGVSFSDAISNVRLADKQSAADKVKKSDGSEMGM